MENKEMVENKEELENLNSIEKLVKKHWNLEKESFDLFKLRLIERNTPDEYLKILDGSKDGRRRFPISQSLKKDFDEGWKLFCQIFHKEKEQLGINYKDYCNGKVTIGKQKVKIKKAISNKYVENRISKDSTFTNMLIFLQEKELVRKKYFSDFCGFEDNEEIVLVSENSKFLAINFSNLKKERVEHKKTNKKLLKAIDSNSVVYEFPEDFEKRFFKEHLTPLLLKNLNKDFEKIGACGLPKTLNMELVFSINPADLMLCSTSENWGSCLSFDSEYSGSEWKGLPGLITERSRAIFYLTNNQTKKYTFNGISIKADKMLSRTLLLSMRRPYGEEKPYLNVIKNYPNNHGFCSMMQEIPIFQETFSRIFNGSPSSIVNDLGLVSKDYAESLFMNIGNNSKILLNIYNDSTNIVIARKNIAKDKPYGNYFYHKNGSGSRTIMINEQSEEKYCSTGIDCSEDYYGLTYIIDEGFYIEEVLNFSDEN